MEAGVPPHTHWQLPHQMAGGGSWLTRRRKESDVAFVVLEASLLIADCVYRRNLPEDRKIFALHLIFI